MSDLSQNQSEEEKGVEERRKGLLYALGVIPVLPTEGLRYTLAHLTVARTEKVLVSSPELAKASALWDLPKALLGYCKSPKCRGVYDEVLDEVYSLWQIDPPTNLQKAQLVNSTQEALESRDDMVQSGILLGTHNDVPLSRIERYIRRVLKDVRVQDKESVQQEG